MSEASPSGASQPSGNSRQTILLLVLGLMVIALAYDYKVARPSVDAAYDQIVQKSMQVNSTSTETLTNLGVRELLQMEPSETFEEANGDMVEVYSWRSGLPIRTHNLYSVYKKNGGEWLFHRHSKFLHESSTDVSQHDVRGGSIVEAAKGDVVASMQGGGTDDASSSEGSEDSEATDLEESSSDDGSNESGSPGGPPTAADGVDPFAGSSAFDPEVRARSQPDAVFSENDEDEDGKLTGDEIPQISNQTKTKMDKDGDGVLTKEEWMAEMKSTSEQPSASSEASEGDGQE